MREGPLVICDRSHGEQRRASWMKPGQGYNHLQNPSQPNDLISQRLGCKTPGVGASDKYRWCNSAESRFPCLGNRELIKLPRGRGLCRRRQWKKTP